MMRNLNAALVNKKVDLRSIFDDGRSADWWWSDTLLKKIQ